MLGKFSGNNWAWTSVDRLLRKIDATGVTERPKGNGRDLHIYKNPHEIKKKMDISQSSVRRIANRDLRLKIYKSLSGLLSFARLRHFVSTVDSNKSRSNVKNKITLIYPKFRADLINILKLQAAKTKWPSFLRHPVGKPQGCRGYGDSNGDSHGYGYGMGMGTVMNPHGFCG